MSTDILQKKWAPILEHTAMPRIEDAHKRAVMAQLLENQEIAIRENQSGGYVQQTSLLNETTNVFGNNVGAGGAGPAASEGGAIDYADPVLISLVRRAMPNLIAYDIAGVQPMSGPTGLIFAMRSRYGNQGDEALFNEALTGFSNNDAEGSMANGDNGGTSDVLDGAYSVGGGMSTTESESLGNGYQVGGTGNSVGDPVAPGSTFAEMSFSIEKVSVVAKSRALKAEYTMELAQDLKAVHGLDAEQELANILSAEVLAEINREVVRTINSRAKTGAATGNTAVNGIFNLTTDADGRWSVEKFKGLIVQIEREANTIAKETRRGKGNFIVCSSDVASALAASGMLDYSPALSTNLNVDDTGNTFAGVLNGRTRVYIDPYSTTDYVTVGYKGTNPYDAGLFYCPYVPLTMVRAVGENDFQPRIGFKTRYGMVANPFVGSTPDSDIGSAKSNQYYRIFRVDNILA